MNRHALEVLEFAAICDRLADRTSFSASRELAQALTPQAQASTVYLLQAETAEARRLLERTPPRFAGAHDVRSARRSQIAANSRTSRACRFIG